MRRARGGRLTGKQCFSAAAICALALFLGLPCRSLRAELLSQDFEPPEWPAITTWTTHTDSDGWVINDAKVLQTRGSYGTPLGTQSLWLQDYDESTNSWVRTPLLPHGAEEISYWSRRDSDYTGNNELTVQSSTDGIHWTTHAVVISATDNWTAYSNTVNVVDPVYVRILKSGDNAAGQYLGLDNISISEPPGVLLHNLQQDPPNPTFSDRVSVSVEAGIRSGASNVTILLRYRYGQAGDYLPLPMVNTTGITYRTVNPIPSGYGTVEYYVEADYEGISGAPVFLPEDGPADPVSYHVDNPFTTDTRSLSPSSHRSGLIISEIMYHPAERFGTNSLEFVEIFNTDPVDLNIGGYRISGDVDYVFPEDAVIAARTFLIVARDPSAAAVFYGFGNVFGPFEGNLPNGGGTVRLRNELDALLLEVEYDDQLPWPIAADGAGHSLVLSCPDYGEDDVKAWSASARVGGSAGTIDPVVSEPLRNVVINEFLAHTDLPLVDYIELYNHGTETVSLSGCFLSDTPDTNKFVIPGRMTLGPGGFIVFHQDELGFSLSSHGDDIFLVSADGSNVIDAVRFGAQVNGESTGRFPDGADAFHQLAARSPGEANTPVGPFVDGVVINEIMYHPISGLDEDEYIELYNKGAAPIDLSYWRFVDGIEYVFPEGTVLAAGGYLVVAKDRARLLGRYGQLNEANTLGDYSGRLSDRGERVALARPDDMALPFEDFVLVDEVTYGEGDNWGRWSDGGGSSLELIDARADNRLPMNWAGSDETGKADWTDVSYTGTVDNGIMDAWNELHVFDLQDGEFLVDDIQVASSGGGTHLSESFEGGQGSWSFIGSHVRSGVDGSGGYGGGKCLHIRASAKGDNGGWHSNDPFRNRAFTPLSSVPAQNTVATIRARVRWLAGWPHAILALRWYWLEAPVAMVIPDNLGSPGQANSRAAANTGPAISEVAHSPVLPAGGQAVVVTCRVQDPDGVSSVTLKYRVDPSSSNTSVPMTDDGSGVDAAAGDGIFSAAIPGLPAGNLAVFHVEATDSVPSSPATRFPEAPPTGVPQRECLVRFGHTKRPGVFGTYTLWITAANISRWQTLSNYSNEPIDVTLVFGDYRAVYNCGARWRGLWRGYTNPLSEGQYSIDIPAFDRFMGQTEIKIDQPGQSGSDNTRQLELFSYWLTRESDLPAPRVRFVHVQFNGNYRGTHHDFQPPSLDFCESWFGDDDPEVFKAPGWVGEPYAVYTDGLGHKKQSRYRWNNRRKRPKIPSDDFGAIYTLADAFATPGNSAYDARVSAVVDVRGWAGFFGACAALGAWDHYGYSYCHNNFAYIPRHSRSWLLLYDMDHTLSVNPDPQFDVFPRSQWPVPTRLFNRPGFRRVYWALMKEIVSGPLDPARAHPFLDEWYALFLENGVSQNNGTPAESPSALKSWISSRHSYLLSQVATVNAAFAITSNGGNDFSTAEEIVTLSGSAPVEVETIRVNGIEHRPTFPSVTAWSLRTSLHAGANTLLVEGYDRHGNLVPGATDGISVTLSTAPPSPAGHILFSEIMYHPPEGGVEYVELYNNSPTESFDLSGMRINGLDHVFGGGRIIAPLSYAVLTANISTFQHALGNAEVVLDEYKGSLDNDGETLSLWMPASSGDAGAFSTVEDGATNWWVAIDTVTYSDRAPWPTDADGQGASLQLLDSGEDNNRIGNWGAVDLHANEHWQYAAVTGRLTDNVRISLDDVKVHFYLNGAGRIYLDKVYLCAGTEAETGPNLLSNGGFEEALSGQWILTGNHAGSGRSAAEAAEGAYSLELLSSAPGDPGNSLNQHPSGLSHGIDYTLSYRYLPQIGSPELTALMTKTEDTLIATHATAALPVAGPYATPGAANNVAVDLPPFPELWINEVMPSNVNVAADNFGEYDPWVELYNAGSNSVGIGGFYLGNDMEDLDGWAFPEGTSIGAGERLLVWADGQTNQTAAGALHAGFRLSPAGGAVVLSRSYQGRMVVIDWLDYAAVGEDFSFGSYPEGDPRSRLVFHYPTPGYANSAVSLPAAVRINEWMADNDGVIRDLSDGNFDDWFELYNAGAQGVNLAGYTLTDNLAVPDKFLVTDMRWLPAGGHMLVWADEDTQDNAPGEPLHVNFKLSAGGEELGLYAPDGSEVDAVVFGAQAVDRGDGSYPDGSGIVYPMRPPTPGTTNRVLIIRGTSAESPSGFTVSWLSEPGAVYRVEYVPDLLQSNWTPMMVLTADAPDTFVIDTNALDAIRFYRISEIGSGP